MFRKEKLVALLRSHGQVEIIDGQDSQVFWRDIRDVLFFSGDPGRTVWRISVAPSRGPEVAVDLTRQLDAEHFFDWEGGLLWVTVDTKVIDGGADAVRTAVAAHGGGHATLVRAPDTLRVAVPVFDPLAKPLAALTLRIKESFDPRHILNPGRMYAGI